jgi:signal-transduction protein with cAMP-binding, CBS, and nucleotidyltransferase domain
MTLHYYLKGEKLYRIGEEAHTLFVVYSGLVSRRVIIELEQVNKIPPYARKDSEGVLLY